MSAALRPLPPAEPDDVAYVHPSSEMTNDRPFRELARVLTTEPALTIEGDEVPAGASGTIVAVWNDGDWCDLEFDDAMGPATIRTETLRPIK